MTVPETPCLCDRPFASDEGRDLLLAVPHEHSPEAGCPSVPVERQLAPDEWERWVASLAEDVRVLQAHQAEMTDTAAMLRDRGHTFPAYVVERSIREVQQLVDVIDEWMELDDAERAERADEFRARVARWTGEERA